MSTLGHVLFALGIAVFILTAMTGMTYLCLMGMGIVQPGPPAPWMWGGLVVAVWLIVPGGVLLWFFD